jgi:hypothetical protein
MEIAKSQIEELIKNHLAWYYTRRFYAPPTPPNIFARLQVDRRRSKEPPNARNDPMCHAYNLVIEDASVLAGERDNFKAYFFVYYKDYRINPQTGKPTLIKTVADELGIAESSVYDRAHAAALRYYSETQKLVERFSRLKKEESMIVDYD